MTETDMGTNNFDFDFGPEYGDEGGEPIDPSELPSELKDFEARLAKFINDPKTLESIQKAYLRACMLTDKTPNKTALMYIIDYFKDIASKYMIFEAIKTGKVDIAVFPNAVIGEIVFGFLGEEEKEALKTMEDAEGGLVDNLLEGANVSRIRSDIPISQLSRVRVISKASKLDKATVRFPRWLADKIQEA